MLQKKYPKHQNGSDNCGPFVSLYSWMKISGISNQDIVLFPNLSDSTIITLRKKLKEIFTQFTNQIVQNSINQSSKEKKNGNQSKIVKKEKQITNHKPSLLSLGYSGVILQITNKFSQALQSISTSNPSSNQNHINLQEATFQISEATSKNQSWSDSTLYHARLH